MKQIVAHEAHAVGHTLLLGNPEATSLSARRTNQIFFFGDTVHVAQFVSGCVPIPLSYKSIQIVHKTHTDGSLISVKSKIVLWNDSDHFVSTGIRQSAPYTYA